MRKLVVEGSEYKVVHRELLCDLLLLSTSTYSQVKLTKHTLINSLIYFNEKNTITTSACLHFPDVPDCININISCGIENN